VDGRADLTRVVVPSSVQVTPDNRVGLGFPQGRMHVFDEGTGRRRD
jgi:hypothetical protein